MNENYPPQRPDSDAQRQAAEAIKNFIVERKKSRAPLIFGILFLILAAGAAAYWYEAPPERQQQLAAYPLQWLTLAKDLLNKPIVQAPATPLVPATPLTTGSLAPSTTVQAVPASAADDNSLISPK